MSRTPVPSRTSTLTPTKTRTPTRTATATKTNTPSRSRTPTKTATRITQTKTYTKTVVVQTLTPNRTRTTTPTPTRTNTHTYTPTRTGTVTQTRTPTATATHTRTATPTPTSNPNLAGMAWKFYYLAGAERVAMRVIDGGSNQLYYLFSDHLGSTSEVRRADGSLHSRQYYRAFGEERYTSGALPTDRTYTGQREIEFGLVHYGARVYDPYLNRFLSPDSIVPDQFNPLDWDRYSYTRNNPLRFADPTGHRPDELGCEVDGCYTEQDLRDIAYFEARQFYVSCQNGGGSGCPNYGDIAAFTFGGLVGAAALPEVVGGLTSFTARAAPIACADGDCTNEFGQITSVGKGVWQSSQGLLYETWAKGGNAIQHILEHMKDAPSKPIQGVFTVGRSEVLSLIDEAWVNIQSLGSNVVAYESQAVGQSTAYLVDMGRTIGYLGGQYGPLNGFPATPFLQIVLRGSSVISAYPALP